MNNYLDCTLFSFDLLIFPKEKLIFNSSSEVVVLKSDPKETDCNMLFTIQRRWNWLIHIFARASVYRVRKHVLLDPVNYKIARDCNWQFRTHANSFGYDGRCSRNLPWCNNGT